MEFFFVLPTLSHRIKNLPVSQKNVSYLTCILIEGTFPSTNQHPCTFLVLKVLQCTRCTRNSFCTTKNNFWVTDGPLTKNYGLVRAADDVTYVFRSAPSLTADFWRKTSSPKLSLKKNKVERESGSGLTFEDLQTVGTADYEMKGLLRSLRNHRFHVRWSPSAQVTATARILGTVVKYFVENIQC